MQTLHFTIQPLTAFGTPLAGDTLFGQLCWALRRRFGNDWLSERLQDYCQGRPFMVIADAFPKGFLPLPAVPASFWRPSDEDRKALKKKRWLPLEEIESDFGAWQGLARNDAEAADEVLPRQGVKSGKMSLQTITPQPHNTISRATATTGEGMFAPYSQAQIWFYPAMRFDLYAVIDASRISADQLTTALTDIGQTGYGANASVGLGKFAIERDDAFTGLLAAPNANAWLTLAPCAPQGLGFAAEKSFYQPLTRFGRHGDQAALAGSPFKRPLLMSKTGAVFTPEDGQCTPRAFIGQGLNDVSPSQPQAVAQGYAPVVGIRIQHNRETAA